MFPGSIVHIMLKCLIGQIVVVFAQASKLGTHDWNRVVHISLIVPRVLLLTSHRYCCPTWLLWKVICYILGGIIFQVVLPVLPKLLVHIARSLHRLGVTLSWDPSFPYNFPDVLEVVQ
jgi:hypothetical protein